MDQNESPLHESQDKQPTLIGRSNRRRFLWIPAIAVFNFLLPPFIFFISTPDALLTGVWLSVVFVPLGMLFLLIGISYLQLRVEIQTDQVRLALPFAEIEPWFPWLLQRVSMPTSELQKIEVKHRYNAYASNQTEKLAVLHTAKGAFQLNSIWFPKYDELVDAIACYCKDPNVMTVESSLAGPPTLREQWVRRFTRGAEVLSLGALMVLGVLALSGRSEHAGTLIACIMLFFIARPAFQTLRHYRQAV